MKIIEASEIPSEDKVYLKKDILGWRVVHPIKNEDGSYNWFNLIFGSRSNLVFLIILLILIVAFYFGINQLIGNYKVIADNPCNFCEDCFEQTRNVLSSLRNNITTIKPINFTTIG